MDGIKLIDASEVEVKKKTSKVEIKKISKTPPIKIIPESTIKIITEITVKSSDESDKLSQVNVDNVDKVDKSDKQIRTIRAIKLKEDIYYGPKNINKNKFMRMYKKLGLAWIENISIDGMMVGGWFNKDRSQYIIKLLEEGGFKRFKFYGCDEIYAYFINLGGIAFDHTKENSISPIYKQVNIAKTDIGVGSVNLSGDIGKIGEFIGADLWSGYRTKQLLKDMPDNWGIKWK